MAKMVNDIMVTRPIMFSCLAAIVLCLRVLVTPPLRPRPYQKFNQSSFVRFPYENIITLNRLLNRFPKKIRSSLPSKNALACITFLDKLEPDIRVIYN